MKLINDITDYCAMLWREGLQTMVYTALWTLWITACLLWLVHTLFIRGL